MLAFDPDTNAIPRRRERHEDDTPIGSAAHAIAAGA
jgi:hypothetical protein